MRNLASIQKIISLEQIPGKDKIELATVGIKQEYY